MSIRKNLEHYCKSLSNNYYETENVKEDILHSDMWLIGGATGGNCWGDEATPISIYDLEDEKEFTQLDNFLEIYYPEISFLDYKKIMKKVNLKEKSYSEYYGNYRQYKYKAIKKEDLIDVLSDILVKKRDMKSKFKP